MLAASVEVIETAREKFTYRDCEDSQPQALEHSINARSGEEHLKMLQLSST
ncbi:hypothetical protein ACVWY3_004183 [Bradyrhizobium sp. USDA 4486]